MAEYKRDKRLFRAFHSTDADAIDILMSMYDQAYPEMDPSQRAETKQQAQDAIDSAQAQNSWFLISPEGQIQLVPALAMVLAFEDVDSDVWFDVQSERVRQIEKGYTPEHDDEHGGDHLLQIAKSYISLPEDVIGIPLAAQDVRSRIVKAIATLVATVEFIDRSEKNALVGQLAMEEGLEELEDTQPLNPESEQS